MEEKKTHIHPRKFARKMAKHQLDRRGATGYNKHGRKAPSQFSAVWKHFAIEASQPRNMKGANK